MSWTKPNNTVIRGSGLVVDPGSIVERRFAVWRARLALVMAALVALAAAPPARARQATPAPAAVATAAVDVDAVNMTVSDMDRAVTFYSTVLDFEKVSDEEVVGEDFERLSGVFGSRARVVRMRLGDEAIELTEFLAPKGRPIPVDSRSNDGWFQHVAIIVSDMDRAYTWLRQHKVEHASTGPQRLPDWNRNAGGIEAFYFKDPDGHPARRSGIRRPTGSSSGSTTRRLSSRTRKPASRSTATRSG